MQPILYVGNRNYSSWSMRGSLLVRMTGMEYREDVIPLFMAEGRDRLREISPSGRVPSLHIDGIRIWDSLAIAEYLHERFPDAGIWPAAPDRRAWARSISAEMHSGFNALRNALPVDIRARDPERRIGDVVRTDIRRIEQIWSQCRTQSGAGGDFLFGAWSGADCMYAPVVSRFVTYGVTLGDAAQRYAEAVWEWPDVRDWVAAATAEPWEIDFSNPAGAVGRPRTT